MRWNANVQFLVRLTKNSEVDTNMVTQILMVLIAFRLSIPRELLIIQSRLCCILCKIHVQAQSLLPLPMFYSWHLSICLRITWLFFCYNTMWKCKKPLLMETFQEYRSILSKFESVKIYWLSVKFDWFK